jgi:hypothetical protein
MDIGFLGMLVVLLLMTAGPIFLVLLGVAVGVAKAFGIKFESTLIPLSIAFVPLHTFAMFALNPGIPATRERLLEGLGISVLFVVPILAWYAVLKSRGKREVESSPTR